MLKKFGFAFTVLFIGITGISLGSDNGLVVIKDLKDDWMVFDHKGNTYVPFTENDLGGTLAINFSLSLTRFKNHVFKLDAPEATSIFFNQELIAYLENTDETLIFKLDSLGEVYSGDLWVTLYNPNFRNENQVKTLVVRPVDPALLKETSIAEQVELIRRDHSGFSDFFVTGVILLLTLYALILNLFHKKLVGFYNVGRAFSLSIREEMAFKGKLFDGANTPILLVHSFLISFVGYSIYVAMDQGTFVTIGYWSSLANWAVFAIAIFFLLIFKYWMLWLLGILFKLPFVNRHYLEYVRLSKIFFGVVFALLVLLYLGANLNLDNIVPILINIIIVFFFLRIVLLYFKFIQSSSFNNLYLISYLCSAEILPIVVGLKILLR